MSETHQTDPTPTAGPPRSRTVDLANAGRPKKRDVRYVACPRCGAEPGAPCRNERSGAARHRNHIERVRRYRDGMYGPVPAISKGKGSTVV